MNILNFCDINDEAKNLYYNELLKYYDENDILTLKYDPKVNPAEYLLDLMNEKYDLIVGHGFGGLLALVIGRVTGTKTILINPMYPASRYWSELCPDYEYKRYIERVTERSICWDTDGKTTDNVFIFLGKDDDLIDTSTTDKYLTRENSYYVEGGHWPSGEDFVLKFGELVGGLLPSEDGSHVMIDAEEEQAFTTLGKFIDENEESRILYLYSWRDDADKLTKAAVRYMNSIEETEGKLCYITADTLPVDGPDVRKHFYEVKFLIIDKIVRPVLSNEVRRSIWIACDEVTGHGGRVLLLSESAASWLFEEDKELMDMFYTGTLREIHFYNTPRGISIDSGFSGDRRPFEDYYRTVIIDEIKTQYGNLAIRWHSPELEERWLYLYYKDDQWFYDSQDGWCNNTQAKAVLRAAVDKFVDEAKDTDHDAHHFFGWGW